MFGAWGWPGRWAHLATLASAAGVLVWLVRRLLGDGDRRGFDVALAVPGALTFAGALLAISRPPPFTHTAVGPWVAGVAGAVACAASPVRAAGLGFAVLEGPGRLIDWGVKQARADKSSTCLKLFRALIGRYRPDFIAVEDVAAPDSHRCRRVQHLIDGIKRVAAQRRLAVRSVSRRTLTGAFTGSTDAVTKHPHHS